ncbi:hypothetical protein LG202_27670 [Methylobacillus methanolivorans]
MDTVQRLILIMAWLWTGVSYAATEQVEAKYRWSVNVSGANTGFHNTAQLACDSYGSTHADKQNASAPAAHKTYAYTGIQAVNHQTYLCVVKNQLNVDASFTVNRQWSCDNTTWNSGNNEKYYCTVPACVPPAVRQPDGTCKAPPQCTPGCNGVCGTEQPLTGKGTMACFNGCYYGLGDAFGLVVSNGQKTWWTDVEDNTGVPCDAPEDEQPDGAEDAPDPAETPSPCPECDCAKKGMTWGSYTTNGTTTVMCLKPGTPGGKPVDIAPKPTVKTETPAPTPENPNPEPTTTVTPSPVITITPGSGAGSQPTVTETTTNPDGSTTSTSEPQEAYCQKNPNAKVCKEADKEDKKGTWGGGCGSWECEGDAANCAMSRKIHQDRCDDIEGMEQFADAAGRGQRILHGEEDEDVTAYLNREGDGNRTINVGSLVSDSGPYSFGASCISDVQFSIGGHSVSVPFSKICPYLEMIGYFLLAAAYLAALRIVGFI